MIDFPRRGRQAASILTLAAAVVCLYSMRQADPDLWGYLTYGRFFVESHGLRTPDPFAYTSAGFQWMTFEYGAQLLLWWSYHLAGPLGLITLKCVVGGVALWCLFLAVRATTREPFIWAPIFLLCASALSRFFVFRPQLFTFAFFALFAAVLFRYLLRRPAPLWALPIVMLVWANLHGGFLAGLGALGLAILLRASENLAAFGWKPGRLGEGTGLLGVTLAACTAVTFINPLGPRLWVYILTEVLHGTNRRFIAEWAPASLHRDAWSLIALTLIAVTLAVVGWTAHRRGEAPPGPLPISWIVSCVPLIALSYLSVRHLPLAAIWTGPVIALLASSLQGQLPQRAWFRRSWFLLRGLGVLQAGLIVSVVYAEPLPAIHVDGTVLGPTHPCGAVAFLRDRGVRGHLYNPLWWGAYITWELYPSVLVSMDGRNVSLFSDALVLENMKFYTDGPGQADLEVPFRYATDFLIVPADAPVLPRVQSDPRWRHMYADGDAFLFERARAGLPASGAAPRPAGTNRCPAVLE